MEERHATSGLCSWIIYWNAVGGNTPFQLLAQHTQTNGRWEEACKQTFIPPTFSYRRFRGTYKETGDTAGLPTQHAGRWGHMEWNTVSVEEKKYFLLGYLEQARKGKKRHEEPNKPTKKGPLSFVLLFESPFASVVVSKGHLSLVSLDGKYKYKVL